MTGSVDNFFFKARVPGRKTQTLDMEEFVFSGVCVCFKGGRS